MRGCTMMNESVLPQIISFSIAPCAGKYNLQFAFFNWWQLFSGIKPRLKLDAHFHLHGSEQ